MMTRTQVINMMAASLIVSALSIVEAKAEPQGQYFAHVTAAAKSNAPVATKIESQGQFFSHMTDAAKEQPQATKKKDEPVQGALAICSPRTPIVDWFERMDTAEYRLRCTRTDRALLERPFNEEAERVHEWTLTAGKVAQGYRTLATLLSSMDIPKDGPLLKQFRDEKADWYRDTASVLEDLIKPRKAATTQEELDAQVKAIEQRTISLRAEQRELEALDIDLRKQYKVHLAKERDALQQYINGKVPSAN
jgi:hypothetical protein